jgi:hypothetical protein
MTATIIDRAAVLSQELITLRALLARAKPGALPDLLVCRIGVVVDMAASDVGHCIELLEAHQSNGKPTRKIKP